MNTQTPEIDLEKVSPCGYIILVTGEINQDLADEVTQKLIEIDLQNKSKGSLIPVTLVINSPGGELASGWQICDVMDYIDTPVFTTGLGQIASAALLVFMNGQYGHRALSERASVMSHRYRWGIEGTHKDLIAAQPEFENIHNRIVKHYIECTGLSKEIIEENLLQGHDSWFTATDAKKYNITDKIIHSKKLKIKECKKIKDSKVKKGKICNQK